MVPEVVSIFFRFFRLRSKPLAGLTLLIFACFSVSLYADSKVPVSKKSAKVTKSTAPAAKTKKYQKVIKKSPHQNFVERITKPVVGIMITEFGSGVSENTEERIDGSGFIVDPNGYVVTNCHVIDGASGIEVVLHDGTRYAARVVGSDSNSDTALLKIEANAAEDGKFSDTSSKAVSSGTSASNIKFPCAAFADSDDIDIASSVYAVGYPFGFGVSVTKGIISAKMHGLPNQIVDIGMNIPFLLTDARINYGNSGGPLFTDDGRVVGMVTVFVAEGSQNTGMSFAIPSKLLRRNIEQLKIYGKLRKIWVGFLAIPLDNDIASELGLKDHYAFAVVSVEKGSPADVAGICPGDLILSINGEDMHPNTNLEYILQDLPIDEVVPIVAMRSKQEITFDLKVGYKDDERSSEAEEPEGNRDHAISYQEVDCLSIGVADLTNKLRDHFGIPYNINGVLIANVGKRHSRMSVGNVILSVNQKRVSRADSFIEEMKNLTLSKAPSVVFEVYDSSRQVPWFYVKFALIYGNIPAAVAPGAVSASSSGAGR